MRTLKIHVVAMLACPLLLGGCESMNLADEGFFTGVKERIPWIGSETQPAKTISVTNAQDMSAGTDGPMTPMAARPEGLDRLAQAPGVQPVPPHGAKLTESEIMAIASQTEGNKVQVYDSNGGGMDSYGGGGYAPMPNYSEYAGGVPAAQDSGVTIYPVEGGGAGYTGGYAGGSYPGMTSTFSGSYGSSVPSYSGAPEGQKQSELGSGYNPSKIYFGHGSSSLDSQDRQVLREASEQAKFSPVERVRVEGFASSRTQTGDPVQSRILNLKESTNRALTVSSELMRDGVPAEKIETTAWGDTRPPMNGSEAEARRVDVYTGGGY